MTKDNFENKQMADGGDDDEDHEDVFILLELPDTPANFLSSNTSYSLIGLDTPTPVLKIGSAVFRGTHEDVLGTHLVFSDAGMLATMPGASRLPTPVQQPGAAQVAADQRLVCAATQKIRFERVLLEPRGADTA